MSFDWKFALSVSRLRVTSFVTTGGYRQPSRWRVVDCAHAEVSGLCTHRVLVSSQFASLIPIIDEFRFLFCINLLLVSLLCILLLRIRMHLLTLGSYSICVQYFVSYKDGRTISLSLLKRDKCFRHYLLFYI